WCSSGRDSSRVVLAFTSFFLFCMSSAVNVTVLLDFLPVLPLCNLPGSGFSFLLTVATFFTSSGNFFCQWELYTWQWECLVQFIPNNQEMDEHWKLQSHCYFNKSPGYSNETLTVECAIPTVSSPIPTACLDDSPEPSSDTNGVEADLVIRNKARLVAQGHTQEEGINYEEVFAPVAKIEAIRLFLAYASFMGFTVYLMDVKSAFLYGTINEEVYDPEFLARVYKVKKAMYGLHQAPKVWHQVTPKECHLHVVKRIFRYLKGHHKLGLWYPEESPFDLVAYSDSDYGGAT
nr:copia protein [Tanacetum cinerariifolium]